MPQICALTGQCRQHTLLLRSLLHLHFNRNNKSCGMNSPQRSRYFPHRVLSETECTNLHVRTDPKKNTSCDVPVRCTTELVFNQTTGDASQFYNRLITGEGCLMSSFTLITKHLFPIMKRHRYIFCAMK